MVLRMGNVVRTLKTQACTYLKDAVQSDLVARKYINRLASEGSTLVELSLDYHFSNTVVVELKASIFGQ